jgi:hypothetical protein
MVVEPLTLIDASAQRGELIHHLVGGLRASEGYGAECNDRRKDVRAL